MDAGKWINRRKFFRIECANPLCGEVTIIRVNNQAVNTGKTKVCVEDIGPGGLKFISKLDMPVNPNIIVKFYMVVSNQSLLVQGFIVRKVKMENDIFQYGVQFNIEDSEIKQITKVLSELEYMISKGVKNTNSNFCIKDRLECFNIKKSKTEQRAYFRFQCPSPLCAKLIIKKINNKLINSDGDRVCIEDIGQGGLRFLSHINYPVIEDIYYEFEMIVSGARLFLRGYIVRKKVIEPGIFEYGVRLDIFESQKAEIKQLIDEMKNSLNKKHWFKKSSFCKKNKIDCLRARSIEQV